MHVVCIDKAIITYKCHFGLKYLCVHVHARVHLCVGTCVGPVTRLKSKQITNLQVSYRHKEVHFASSHLLFTYEQQEVVGRTNCLLTFATTQFACRMLHSRIPLLLYVYLLQ
jgi:hypothetical protein